MSKYPLVSVIIPCYNYARYLPECLDSVLAQSYPSWECIIVDDGSEDDTRKVALEYAKKDSRISYLFQKNSGPNAARNLGLEVSKGDFIQLLDADDMLEPDKIRYQVEIHRINAHVDIVYSHHRIFGESFNGHKNQVRSFDTPEVSGSGVEIGRALLKGPFTINSPLIPKELFRKVGLFNPAFRYNEDWMFWLSCLNAGCKFIFNSQPGGLALVRRHENNTSSNLWNTYYYRIVMRREFSKHSPFSELVNLNLEYLNSDIDFLMNIAIDTLKLDYQKGVKKVFQAFLIKPGVRYLLYLVFSVFNAYWLANILRQKSFRN